MTKERMPKKHRVGETKERTLKTEFLIHLPDITINEPGRYHVTAKVSAVRYLKKA